MSPLGYDRARAHLISALHALEIPRLSAEDVIAMERPNVPLSQLDDNHLDALLSVIDDWMYEVETGRASQ